jgi:hypothetical protein
MIDTENAAAEGRAIVDEAIKAVHRERLALANIDKRQAEAEASAIADADAREAASMRLAYGDPAAADELAALQRRNREREDEMADLGKAREGVKRAFALAERRYELAEEFGEQAARLGRFNEMTAGAARYDALVPQLASIAAEMDALARMLCDQGSSSPAVIAYTPPPVSAVDLVHSAGSRFERAFNHAKSALEDFDRDPRLPPTPEEREEQRQRNLARMAQEKEAERLQKIAEQNRKEREAAEERQRAIAKQREWQRENGVIIRANDPANEIIDLTPRGPTYPGEWVR